MGQPGILCYLKANRDFLRPGGMKRGIISKDIGGRQSHETVDDLTFQKLPANQGAVTRPLSALTVSQLKRAVAIKQRIEDLERELASLIGQSSASGASASGGIRRRRKMSAAARAKIAAAARARWARFRANKAKK